MSNKGIQISEINDKLEMIQEIILNKSDLNNTNLNKRQQKE